MDNVEFWGLFAFVTFLIVDLLWLGFSVGRLSVMDDWLEDARQWRNKYYLDKNE